MVFIQKTKTKSDCNSQGFTLVEALVAMAIFMLGFSGLYFFYGLSQHTIVDAEKRMYLNLMADRIVQTIAASGQLAQTNDMNAFRYPNCYKGSLNFCPKDRPDGESSCSNVLQTWAYDICQNNTVGAASGSDKREIDLFNDGTGLIVNVSLTAANGKVSVFYTRKLREL